MDFEVYCDESGIDALIKKSAHSYTSIGGIWMPSSYREEFKLNILKIKNKHKVYGELKWSKISPAYFEVYKDLIDYFFESEELRFRCIVVEARFVNDIKFHGNDTELSFYKFYYQLLQHWIYDFNDYAIFLDKKVNKLNSRLSDLKRVLNNANLFSNILSVQALPSNESAGIQLADILTGIVNAKFNNITESRAKKDLIFYIEQRYLEREIYATPKSVEKFNIFKINLKGGW